MSENTLSVKLTELLISTKLKLKDYDLVDLVYFIENYGNIEISQYGIYQMNLETKQLERIFIKNLVDNLNEEQMETLINDLQNDRNELNRTARTV